MLPLLRLGAQSAPKVQPSKPGTRRLQSSRGPRGSRPIRSWLCPHATNSWSPAARSWGSGWTIPGLPLPGQPPRLPSGERGTQERMRVPAAGAAGAARAVGAEMKPLPALMPALLPLPPALALRLLGAHSAPPRRPGAAFRTRCVWTAPPGAQPPSGRGRGGSSPANHASPSQSERGNPALARTTALLAKQPTDSA